MADSPLTSTEIYLGYLDEPVVEKALDYPVLTEELLQYLAAPSNPIAVKIAVINALGFNIDGSGNADAFFQYLNTGKRYKNIEDFTQKASGELMICMAYMKSLDDYFDVSDALLMAKKAADKTPQSYTVNIICALIEAQEALDNDWCKVYQLTNNVRRDKTLKDDMNEDAKNEIFEYMDEYKGYCE